LDQEGVVRKDKPVNEGDSGKRDMTLFKTEFPCLI